MLVYTKCLFSFLQTAINRLFLFRLCLHFPMAIAFPKNKEITNSITKSTCDYDF